jgi:hypothetical protein
MEIERLLTIADPGMGGLACQTIDMTPNRPIGNR